MMKKKIETFCESGTLKWYLRKQTASEKQERKHEIDGKRKNPETTLQEFEWEAK